VQETNPFISKIEYYLPKGDYSNNLLSASEPRVDGIIEKVGIDKKFKADKNEYATDMGVKAATKLIATDESLYKTIDYIIYCSQSPDYALPGGSSFIQKSLFPNRHIPAIDINLGCSGFVYSLSLAKALIQSKDANQVLIITAETYSKYINEESTSVRTIFGDGACAILVDSKNNENESILYFDHGTNGEGIENLIVPNSGLRKSLKSSGEPEPNELYMNGPKILNFTLNAVPKTIDKALKKNNLSMKDIDMYVFHQANKFMLEKLQNKLGISDEQFFIALHGKGNTTSSTIPIALKDGLTDKRIRPGMTILICGFGVGYSWSTGIIRLNNFTS
jgi:3-oxoacyl-[acyl-carrier-protein] synthase III